MKRNCLLILLIGFLCTNVFSQNYDERRILFGENYQAIQKISKESESIIKDSYSDVLAFANKFHIFSDSSLIGHGIYKEVHNSFVFYRFLFTDNHSYGTFVFNYLQIFCLAYKNKLYILGSSYLHEKHLIEETIHATEENIYSNYSIIQEKSESEIIMHQIKDKIETFYDYDGEDDSEETIKTQGEGVAYFYKLSDILKRIEKSDNITNTIAQVKLKEYKTARCESTLIDEKCPFMYTIQNAFDKNPETAYVEKSDDNDITISIVSDTKIRRVGIINGFVKTPKLYASNNRIRKIDINNKFFELKDIHSKDFVFFQIPLSANIHIQTMELYKGTRYSDTCIAEIQIE